MPKKKPIVENLTKSVGEITEQAYVLYGGYVANSRALPSIQDGLKVSIRRLIYGAMQYKKGEWVGGDLLTKTMQKWHPHSVDQMHSSAAHLVRDGIFSGHGFFGYTSIDGVESPPAAGRYLKMRLSDLYWDVLGETTKEPFAPFCESPQGPEEPKYFNVPIPICLYQKIQTMGLAVGCRTNIPSFSPKSILMAMKNDDPSLLECSVDLIIDKENSELDRIWRTGRGTLCLAYKISRMKSEDGKSEGILFESADRCSTDIFTPKISKFQKLVDDGKVYIEDLTDENGPKLFVGRVPGARGIAIEDIESIARKICYSKIEYQIWVTDGMRAFRIPIKDWVVGTYDNYINTLVKVNNSKLEKAKFDLAVQEALPVISSYIMNVNPKASDSEIQKETGLGLDIIEAVMSKPISQLRKNKDNSDRIKAIKERIKELKKFDPIVYTDNLINSL
jgi:hypothetical protein